MKTKLFMMICLMLFVTTITAQECFTPTYNRGKELYSNGQYKKALAAFKAAVNCPDRPATNDLASWIKKTEQKIEVLTRQPDENKVYKQSEVDRIPLFPGGENVLNAFIKGKMQYPEIAKTNGQEGTVIVKVIIDKAGKHGNPKIAEARYPILANEALRIVKQMPDWTPAEKNRKKVAVEYTIPIEFKLEKEEKIAISEIVPQGNAQIKETPKPNTYADAAVSTTNNKRDTTTRSTLPKERSFNISGKPKKHQFSLDLGVGMLETSDDYGSWNQFSAVITAQYQYNLSKIVGVNLSAKFLSDFAETSAYGAFVGVRFTVPIISKKSTSWYITPKIGFVSYEDWGESGLTYEIETGVNLSKRLYVGISYMNTPIDGDYENLYLSGFSNISIHVGVRF